MTAVFAVAMLSSCADASVKKYKAVIVQEYPHDSKAYTQGLFFRDGRLYESTGQYGESSFREVELSTGEVLSNMPFSKKYFVEGSVMFKNKLYVLTWTSRVAFVYDANTLEYVQAYRYPRDGWGLTADDTGLIASDGSAKLYFLDENFKVRRSVVVKLDGKPVRYLNELEYINGKVWANIYTSDTIVIINPKDGRVEATVDCRGLLPSRLKDENTDVLNGIAYDTATGNIYLTGKNWKRLYQIKLEEVK